MQGVVAEIDIPPFLTLNELLLIPSQRQEPPFFVILDSIEDPRNFGAIVRTAEAAGVHGIIFPSHRSAGIGPAVFKTSSGALEHIPLSQVVNIKHSIELFTEQGISIIGTAGEATQSIWSVDLTVPVAVVLGSEEKGLKRTVRERCDAVVTIPMKGKIDSLNVSVAAGIVIFEVLRQRMINKGKAAAPWRSTLTEREENFIPFQELSPSVVQKNFYSARGLQPLAE